MGGLPTSTVNGFAVDPTNPQVMYVAMRDGVFRSDNAGGRWARSANGSENVAAVAVNPRRPTEVYAVTVEGNLLRSADGGTQWAGAR